MARESEFEGQMSSMGKRIKSTLSRTVTRAIRRVLLPSSTTNELIRDTHSLAQYEKIRGVLLESFEEKNPPDAPEASSRRRLARDQVNVRLAILREEEERKRVLKRRIRLFGINQSSLPLEKLCCDINDVRNYRSSRGLVSVQAAKIF